MRSKFLFFAVLFVGVIFVGINCAENGTEIAEATKGGLIEEGRTFVHHVVKRFMVILPAIFFKLGVAFTLLLLVTLVAVNNGFIGFLILVVGLSSVLSRMQEGSRRPFPVSVVAAPAPIHAHPYPYIDRSDTSTPIYRDAKKHQNYYPYVERSDPVVYSKQISQLNDLVTQSQFYNNLGNNGEVVYGKYVTGK